MAAYTLYGSFLSAPSYKVALMLTLCGLAYEYRHVDLSKGEHKAPEFLKLNRFGQVPVLVLEGGLSLCQSNTINEYLSETTGKFGGEGLEQRQRIREWMMWETDRLMPGVNRTRFFERFMKPDPAVGAFARKLGDMGLNQLESLLPGKTYLVGDKPTIADIAVLGAVVHAAEGNFDMALYPNIQAWQARMAALPGFKLPYDLMPQG